MDCSTKIRQLRESTGMNRMEFCDFFKIPYRTVTEWERDTRHAPEYVLRLLEYYIKNENLIVSNEEKERNHMKWYEEAVFYHIYPLGLTGAPKHNNYETGAHRLNDLLPWIDHMKAEGFTALYIGPLFESEGHGYETTDYKKLDSRLGTNEDLKNFVDYCHDRGIRVIFDGVFNHTGRSFFAFQDLLRNRENSPYRDWYCNVNFYGNNEYNDGFSYENWGGYNLMAKLNHNNPDVRNYMLDVVRFWIEEFDVDGIRLDAADVLSFDFMKALRYETEHLKPDFWLMGEVIHGDYTRWVNPSMLHAVTNYQLHKALYSGHNDHNYFEIAHSVKRLYDMDKSRPEGLKLYNFADNHDVERIYTRLTNKAHFIPLHILLYTLPGLPSVYYGSEFGIEGRKERNSDDSLRPCLNLKNLTESDNSCASLIARLGQIHNETKALSCGSYTELLLNNRQYAFRRANGAEEILICVNNDEKEADFYLPCNGQTTYIGALSGRKVQTANGSLHVTIPACYGEIWLPLRDGKVIHVEPVEIEIRQPEKAKESMPSFTAGAFDLNKPYEQMSIPELQAAILAKMEKNGPVTDYMKKTVYENVYPNSLINWVKSFR